MALPDYRDLLTSILILEKLEAPKENYYDFVQGLKSSLICELDYHSIERAQHMSDVQAEMLGGLYKRLEK